MFLIIASGVMLFMALYTARVLIRKRWILAGVSMFLMMFLTFYARIAVRAHGNNHFLIVLLWVGVVALGLVSILFFMAVIKQLFDTAGYIISKTSDKFSPSRREFLSKSVGTGLSFAVLPMAGYGVYRAVGDPVLKQVTLTKTDLNPDLKGFRIVQLTDIHAGLTIGAGTVARIVELTNSLEPDVVLITGDLVDGSAKYVSGYIKPLEGLRSTYGTYFVTGNHEYYSGAAKWIEVVKDLGIKVLSNSNDIIIHNGAKLLIAGIPDVQAGSFGFPAPDPGKAGATEEDYDYSVMMSHRPEIPDGPAIKGYDLQLSGHTHGGQYFPWTLVIHLFHQYVRGLYQVGDMQLYVSQGTAYWGPPLRIGAESEITLLTLS